MVIKSPYLLKNSFSDGVQAFMIISNRAMQANDNIADSQLLYNYDSHTFKISVPGGGDSLVV